MVNDTNTSRIEVSFIDHGVQFFYPYCDHLIWSLLYYLRWAVGLFIGFYVRISPYAGYPDPAITEE